MGCDHCHPHCLWTLTPTIWAPAGHAHLVSQNLLQALGGKKKQLAYNSSHSGLQISVMNVLQSVSCTQRTTSSPLQNVQTKRNSATRACQSIAIAIKAWVAMKAWSTAAIEAWSELSDLLFFPHTILRQWNCLPLIPPQWIFSSIAPDGALHLQVGVPEELLLFEPQLWLPLKFCKWFIFPLSQSNIGFVYLTIIFFRQVAVQSAVCIHPSLHGCTALLALPICSLTHFGALRLSLLWQRCTTVSLHSPLLHWHLLQRHLVQFLQLPLEHCGWLRLVSMAVLLACVSRQCWRHCHWGKHSLLQLPLVQPTLLGIALGASPALCTLLLAWECCSIPVN